MSAHSLALEGFIHVPDLAKDAVACAWCHLKLCNFLEPVNVKALHRAYSEDVCQFIQLRKLENVSDISDSCVVTPFQHEASSSNLDSGIFIENESMSFHNLPSQDSHVSSLSSIQERSDDGYASFDNSTSKASSSLGSSKRLETTKRKSTAQLGAASRNQMQSIASGKLKKEPVNMVLSEPIIEEDSEVSEMETSNKVLTLATTSTSNSGAAGPSDKTQTVVDLVSFKDRYVQHSQPSVKEKAEWNKIQIGACSNSQSMNWEVNRLSTFVNKGWKNTTAEKFAAAGFFIASSDIKCAFCNQKLYVCEGERDSCSPTQLHLKSSPSCMFAQGMKLPSNKINIPRLFDSHIWQNDLTLKSQLNPLFHRLGWMV
ncbi:hypothetical protein EB796_008337 [Bugula neritina]|uniref:Uncharacterized protein n=1 Tax=Bugula neritina TaxID=10212 RepID=A0A7J7K730_BUGNE|nr:hypothetical protein EB796_008337 [Bugula neritina]